MVVILVQTRMGSSRLPGKVLKQIDGRPMLSYQVERLRRVSRADEIVIATTESPRDDAIVDFCKQEHVHFFRGSEDDVLSRFYGAATQFNADCIVRVTSDCPLIDPDLIDLAIGAYLDDGKQFDYVSNMVVPTWPFGMAVEVFSFQALQEANSEANDVAEREHVTPFLYWRPDRYRIKSLTRSPDLSYHRWTVDTSEDFELISRILHSIYAMQPKFTMTDVLSMLAEHPDWQKINAHVQQKAALRT